MKPLNKQYVFVCHSEPSNVIFSQVVEYLEAFAEQDLRFELVFLLSGRAYCRQLLGRLVGMEEIRRRLNGRVRCLLAPRLDRDSGVQWAASMLSRLYPQRQNRLLVLHARNLTSACVVAHLKQKRGDVRSVFDVRGDKASEYEFLGQARGLPENQIAPKKEALLHHEKFAAHSADRVFCVSNVLKQIVVSRSGLSEEAVEVFPCGASSRDFRFDDEVRATVRKQLGLTDQFVLVYSGGLSKWHCAEQVIAIAAALMQVHHDVFLLMLTPDVAQANSLLKEALPQNRYWADSATRKEMPGYLMAADMGMLIRNDAPLNRVASPTKLAEYLLCGLPTLISEHIGDYSAMIAASGQGVVIPDNEDLPQIAADFKAFRATGGRDRAKDAEANRQRYSKDAYIGKMVKIYTSF